MADEDRFAGIGEALEEGADDDRDDDQDPEADAADGAAEEPEAAPETPEESSGGPAFSFATAAQQTVYPRPETWSDLQAALSMADAKLRSEHGIDDVEGRELHDAALALAADRVDELVERVAESRRE